MKFTEIKTQSEFEIFCKAAEQSSLIAIDTEFMRDRSYYPKLCLIQLAIENSIALVDPFLIDSYSPLIKILEDPNIIKIFHSAQQDIEVIEYVTEIVPKPLYDTQIAATFLGSRNQIGYADLVHQETGNRLDKSHTRTDWSHRPLSVQQLEYAANDVQYLFEIYKNQTEKLKKLGRLEWYEDEVSLFLSNACKKPEPQNLWKKVKGNQSLKGKQLNILKEIAIWRDDLAQEKNRPRRFIVKDDLLIDIVRLKPKNSDELNRLRQLPKSLNFSEIDALFTSIKEALNQDESLWPQHPEFLKLTKAQESIVDCVMSIIKWSASENDLSTELIATRKDVDATIIRGNGKLMNGWRYTLAGNTIEKFLRGELKITVSNEKLKLSE